MYRPPFRVAAYLVAVVASALIALGLLDFSRQTSNLASVARHENECAHQAKEYSQIKHVFPGRVTAITSHYNEQRHQCLIEVSCERAENGGKSVYDEILNPETDQFVASRSRNVGEHNKPDNTVITGAPVRVDDEAKAQAWFDHLMK